MFTCLLIVLSLATASLTCWLLSGSDAGVPHDPCAPPVPGAPDHHHVGVCAHGTGTLGSDGARQRANGARCEHNAQQEKGTLESKGVCSYQRRLYVD